MGPPWPSPERCPLTPPGSPGTRLGQSSTPGVVSPGRFAELVSERQNVLDTHDVVYGTPYYMAPECLLAAGWTVRQLAVRAELEGDWEGWWETGTDQRPGRES